MPRPTTRFPVRNGERTPGKVAIYATCYMNYNEPGIGHDLLKHPGTQRRSPPGWWRRKPAAACPSSSWAIWKRSPKLKETNIPHLAKLAREGYAIVTAVPSCTLMYKQELPLMFPDDADVKAVAEAMFDPFEYLMLRHTDGLLKTDFKNKLGKVSYHVPCHLRVQNMGQKTREMLQLVPDTEITTVERCSGHDGTWGVKSEFFAESMKIGKPVFKQMAAGEPGLCQLGLRHRRTPHHARHRRRHIPARLLTRRTTGGAKTTPAHADPHRLRLIAKEKEMAKTCSNRA